MVSAYDWFCCSLCPARALGYVWRGGLLNAVRVVWTEVFADSKCCLCVAAVHITGVVRHSSQCVQCEYPLTVTADRSELLLFVDYNKYISNNSYVQFEAATPVTALAATALLAVNRGLPFRVHPPRATQHSQLFRAQSRAAAAAVSSRGYRLQQHMPPPQQQCQLSDPQRER